MHQNTNQMINVGFENYVPVNQILAVLSVDARYIKPLISKAELDNKLINLTRKRKTRSVLLTKEGYLLLNILIPKTLVKRIEQNGYSMMSIGESNYIAKDDVLVFLNKSSSQIEELVKKARAQVRAYNTQGGNITQSYITTKSGYIFLSHFTTKTLSDRFKKPYPSKNSPVEIVKKEVNE